jgi:hypothetical protein
LMPLRACAAAAWRRRRSSRERSSPGGVFLRGIPV